MPRSGYLTHEGNSLYDVKFMPMDKDREDSSPLCFEKVRDGELSKISLLKPTILFSQATPKSGRQWRRITLNNFVDYLFLDLLLAIILDQSISRSHTMRIDWFFLSQFKKNKNMEGIQEEKIFVRVANGHFIRQALPGDDLSDKPTRRADGTFPPKIVTKTTKSGEKIDEAHFTVISGFLQNAWIHSKQYGTDKPNYYVSILMRQEEGDLRQVRFPLFQSSGQGILNTIESVDPSILMEVRLASKESNSGHLVTYSNVFQQTIRLDANYGPDVDSDQPDWKEKDKLRLWWMAKLIHVQENLKRNKVEI